MRPKSFIFDHYHFDLKSGVLQLDYRFEDGPAFREEFYFPPTERNVSKTKQQVIDNAVRLLFFVAGVSYYKAYIPPRLVSPTVPLDRVTADFVRTIYYHGLGEFALVNQLDLSDKLTFVVDETAAALPSERVNLLTHALVPVGGGKDSIVTIETLKRAAQPMTLFSLSPTSGPVQPIADTISRSHLPAVNVARRLAPELKAVNDAGAYNGHVPITAILSCAALVTALITGCNAVVLSNEHSADSPNTVHHGMDVNHQYSKSSAFEKDLAHYVREHLTPDLTYFSLLRPLTETAIAARFAKMTTYHTVFRSCNANFRHDPSVRGSGWCGVCPKCHFVFLALAPFLGQEKMVAIFGRNLLNDSTQLGGFEELCGLKAFKPLECVGTTEESILLVQTLAAQDEWKGTAVIAALAPHLPISEKKRKADFAALFDFQQPHFLSPYYEGVLRETFES
ncbi:MAG: hypothetical protein WC043_09330 [Pseudobdellovibrionaceae bacterium]